MTATLETPEELAETAKEPPVPPFQLVQDTVPKLPVFPPLSPSTPRQGAADGQTSPPVLRRIPPVFGSPESGVGAATPRAYYGDATPRTPRVPRFGPDGAVTPRGRLGRGHSLGALPGMDGLTSPISASGGYRPTTALVVTPEIMDEIILDIEATLEFFGESAGMSKVKRATAAAEIHLPFLTARDHTWAVLMDKADRGRGKLQAIFGGDCARISRAKAIVETALQSKQPMPASATEALAGYLKAIQSVEMVLQDLGLGWQLRKAQQCELEQLQHRQGIESSGVKGGEAAASLAASGHEASQVPALPEESEGFPQEQAEKVGVDPTESDKEPAVAHEVPAEARPASFKALAFGEETAVKDAGQVGRSDEGPSALSASSPGSRDVPSTEVETKVTAGNYAGQAGRSHEGPLASFASSPGSKGTPLSEAELKGPSASVPLSSGPEESSLPPSSSAPQDATFPEEPGQPSSPGSPAKEGGLSLDPLRWLRKGSVKDGDSKKVPAADDLSDQLPDRRTEEDIKLRPLPRATILKAEDDNGVTWYTIRLDSKEQVRTFHQKRFNHFQHLHGELKQVRLPFPLPELPSAGIFGFRHRMDFGDFNSKRQEGLQNFLDNLLGNVGENMWDIAPLKSFFAKQGHDPVSPLNDIWTQ